MAIAIGRDALSGWTFGHQYSVDKNAEDEVKQGKNYALSSAFLMTQFYDFTYVICKLAETINPRSLPRFEILTSRACLLSIPFFFTAGIVKTGPLPTHEMNSRFVQACGWIAEYSGDIMRIAMVVASVALICFGAPAYGVFQLAALGYRELDASGCVPREMSLQIERILPYINLAGSVIQGRWFLQLLCIFELIRSVDSLNSFLQNHLDRLIRWSMRMKGPLLEEYFAPLVEKKGLTYEEINDILDGKASTEINPAHCSKLALDLSLLPEDDQFGHFLTMFNQIDWTKKSALILAKLRNDDDLFIDYLRVKFPGGNIKENFDAYVKQLAAEMGVSLERYLARWAQEQMSILVQYLRGEKRVKGSQEDLDIAISYYKKVLPYLRGLENRTEIEDILLKLALDAGDHCSPAHRRVSEEIVIENVASSFHVFDDPLAAFEYKMRHALQAERKRVIENSYHAAFKKFWKYIGVGNHEENLDRMTHDQHVFDSYDPFFKIGFYPMCRSHLSLLFIAYWECYNFARVNMLNDYHSHLDGVVLEVKKQPCLEYLQAILSRNLTEEQFDDVMASWGDTRKDEDFNRLLFVILGVLRVKTSHSSG